LSSVNLEGDLGEAGVDSGTRWFLAAARRGAGGGGRSGVWVRRLLPRQRRTAVDRPVVVVVAATGGHALDGGEEAGWAGRVVLRSSSRWTDVHNALCHPVPISILKARDREPSRRCRFLSILLYFF
jgi:hypothetical protein